MADLERLKRHASFGGWTELYTHTSTSTKTPMRFSAYLPPQAREHKCPALYFLSGLTCNEENFITKAGVQRYAAEHGLVVIAPDTSPRGAAVPGEDASWDLGTGAGFYVDATEEPWAKNYRMFDYVTSELPALVEAHLPVRSDRRGVSGHSMGGHGALVLGLRLPELYQSVSAFSPICAPSSCPWGEKAFSAYLGDNRESWRAYDATALVEEAKLRRTLLIDQGGADEFLQTQLMPERLQAACAAVQHPIELRMRAGYDHSYYFIASFIAEHVAHHARILNA